MAPDDDDVGLLEALADFREATDEGRRYTWQETLDFLGVTEEELAE
jgi:hypothetical protein